MLTAPCLFLCPIHPYDEGLTASAVAHQMPTSNSQSINKLFPSNKHTRGCMQRPVTVLTVLLPANGGHLSY